MIQEKKQVRQRRTFAPEFKVEAARIVRSTGKSVHVVARELDITPTCLRTWVQQAKVDEQQDPRGALTTDERAELARFRKELRNVEMERDFLKKTALNSMGESNASIKEGVNAVVHATKKTKLLANGSR